MPQSSGLLVIDLQFGFSPKPDLVDRIRDATQDYAVVVATRFCNPPDSLFRTRMNDGNDGGAVIDVGHAVVIDKPGYGLNHAAITVLREFTGITEWGLVGSRTGACIMACGFSLWDAGIPFHVIRDLCASEKGSMCEAVSTVLQQKFGV
ncbi:isochorismatase family protein [Acidithiobacillus sp. 'AMD consortium']|jgi:hypothetical protein|uniref:Isochorismatase family protein n=1 Tax=Acidithiobacillus ferruginosus TaxID=3063951 RepID=A0ACD5IJI2_9PROT|nr:MULTISPECIES: isochorismatase family protein [Acidithiobacillus]MBU2721285.1 isochorismatase family protein [Acidithiobacillus ferridurans]MBU2814225.1 isochorismatase family protein [Acidithiobacillus ferruginosus]QFG77328.1 isochorismatase family protein [Acidithiobacillus sp. 'AMD consortium']RBM02307.1 hypothetical protein C3R74_05055 [Acidithiobacillus ferridurans]